MNEATQAWIALATAVLTSAGAWVWRVLKHSASRQDRNIDWREKRDASIYERMERQLDGCHKRIAELEAERDRVEADRERVEGDRDHRGALAWAWYNKAQELHHALLVYCHADKDEAGRPKLVPERLPPFRDILNGKDKG